MVSDENNYLSKEKFDELTKELEHLKTVRRREIAEQLEYARSLGDLSENAEYDAAKERQGHISRRLGELEDAIARAQVIDPAQITHEKIVFGATVKLVDADSGEELSYQIVGAFESDIRLGKLSVDSPIAKSLIGKEENDVVRVVTPRGAREFQIIEVIYR